MISTFNCKSNLFRQVAIGGKKSSSSTLPHYFTHFTNFIQAISEVFIWFVDCNLGSIKLLFYTVHDMNIHILFWIFFFSCAVCSLV